MALELAVGRPDLVRAPAGADWSREVRAFGDAMAADDLDAATELNLRMWVDGPTRTAAEVDPAVRAGVAEMQRRALELQAPHWDVLEEDMLVPDIGERLGAVHVPTLVLVGEEDVEDFRALAMRMADEIPDARLATIPGAAHVPNLERLPAFDAPVLEFSQTPSVRGGAGSIPAAAILLSCSASCPLWREDRRAARDTVPRS